MVDELSFSYEVANLMYASHGEPITNCLQCGTCSGTCPAVEFMDHTPRQIIGMIRADLKEEVMASNTYWTCASCYPLHSQMPGRNRYCRYDVRTEALFHVERSIPGGLDRPRLL